MIRISLLKIRKLLGFTQIEILVILMMICILAAIGAPSLSGMLESARMKQTAVELRSVFQETQRQSIRKNQPCRATVLIPLKLGLSGAVKGNCLSSGDRGLPKGIGIITNVSPSSDVVSDASPVRHHDLSRVNLAGFSRPLCYFWPSQCEDSAPESQGLSSSKDAEVNVVFGRLGSANFNVETEEGASTSSEHSAKFIAFRPNKRSQKKSCVVLSRSLGLTRLGTYQGPLIPAQITSEGQCRVATWTEQ